MSAMMATRPNRVVTMPRQTFITYSALPMRQEIIEWNDMANFEGLWDWGSFAAAGAKGAFMGAAGAFVTTVAINWVAGPGYVPSVGIATGVGFVAGAVVGTLSYTYDQVF